MAEWEAGQGELRWLEDLIEKGAAIQLRRDGYPNCYTAAANIVFPLITTEAIKPAEDGFWVFGIDEDEEYVQPPGWLGKINLRLENICACPVDAILTIDTWDQS